MYPLILRVQLEVLYYISQETSYLCCSTRMCHHANQILYTPTLATYSVYSLQPSFNIWDLTNSPETLEHLLRCVVSTSMDTSTATAYIPATKSTPASTSSTLTSTTRTKSSQPSSSPSPAKTSTKKSTASTTSARSEGLYVQESRSTT